MLADVIIQARVGSKRLPFKVINKISNYFLIEWIILRLQRAKKINKIILATSKKKRDDLLIKIAKKNKIFFFRGSEKNVLKRIYCAAKNFKSNTIIRVCGDNPFIDPIQVDYLIKQFKKRKTFDYGFNHLNKLNTLYADGFGAEIISFKALKKVYKLALSNDHKEHVTKFIWNNLSKFKVLPVVASKKLAYPSLKFDIDTFEDYITILSLVSRYKISIKTPAEKIIQYKLRELKYAKKD